MPYLIDHAEMFPSLSNVVVGQICPHILAEADCENLFNQSGFIAETRRNRAGRRYYEQLVMLKHQLGCTYCHPPDVKALYMQRFIANDWDESEERDMSDFLDLEKEMYERMFPHSIGDVKDKDESNLVLEDGEMAKARDLIDAMGRALRRK